MTQEELNKILENHQHWIEEDCEDWGNMRADLRGAALYGADLYEADLRGADLRGADLREANLCGADLRGAKVYDNIIAYTNQCPQEGSFIGFKKCSNKIVKLKICEDAKRSNATTNKCRCDKAEVLGIYDFKHTLLEDKMVASNYDKDFIYEVGKIVSVDDFDEDRWNECSTGIHFFLTFEMAVIY